MQYETKRRKNKYVYFVLGNPTEGFARTTI